MTIRLQALPELLAAWDGLSAALAAEGIQLGVADFGGTRTDADTVTIQRYRDQDYAAYVATLKKSNPSAVPVPKSQWRPIAPFGASFHDFGAARDYIIVQRPRGMTPDQAQARVNELAPTFGLRSGRTFNDPRHLELAISLQDAAARWKAYQATVDTTSGAATIAGLVLAIGIGVAVAYGVRHVGGLQSWH